MYPSNMPHVLIKSRAKAFAVHFFGSIAIAVLTLLLVFRLWYPAPLHDAVGVTNIFLLILLVDVSLGPCVTLMLCRTGRRVPVIDIVVIVVVQLSALGFGLRAVAEGRPAWVVFNTDRFDLVRANEIDVRKLNEAQPDFQSVPWLGPQWVAAVSPEGAEARKELIFEALMAGVDLPQHPEYYVPMANVAGSIREKAHPLAELDRYNSVAAVTEVLERWSNADAWLPMKSNVRSMTVLLNMKGAEVIAVVDLRPWDE